MYEEKHNKRTISGSIPCKTHIQLGISPPILSFAPRTKLGLVDEIQLHVVPVLLGDGISLFDGLGERINLERIETAAFASETHLRFRVIK